MGWLCATRGKTNITKQHNPNVMLSSRSRPAAADCPMVVWTYEPQRKVFGFWDTSVNCPPRPLLVTSSEKNAPAMAFHVSPSWMMPLGNRAMQSVLEMRQLEQMEVPMKEWGNHATLQGIQGFILLYYPIMYGDYTKPLKVPLSNNQYNVKYEGFFVAQVTL